MKSEIQLIHPRLVKYTGQANSTLSFTKFAHYIEDQIAHEKTVKKYLFQFVLDQFKNHPEWLQSLDPETTHDRAFLYELIYATVVPSISNEQHYLWGLSLPMTPSIFYGTEGFYAMLQKRLNAIIPDSLRFSEEEKIDQWHYTFVYSFILREIYHLNVLPHNEFTYSYIEEETGLLKYLTITADLRFADVRATGELPKLDMKRVGGIIDHQDLRYLREHIPLSSFCFEGFSILTVADATALNVIENIRSAVIEQDPRELVSTYQEILTLLKSLIGNSKVNFGILPLLEINRHLVIPYSNLPFSFLIKASRNLAISEEVFLGYLTTYCTDPQLLFYTKDEQHDEATPFDGIFQQTDINTLVVIPVFHNATLVGVLEAYTDDSALLNETSLSLLEHAVPLLAQLLQKSIHEFNSYIDFTIKDIFTSIQPSVEWKFKEAVWEHMKELRFDQKATSLPTVAFDQVYPLYGAIDIRNSTTERHKALQADLIYYSNTLLQTLNKIKAVANLPLLDELIAKSDAWCDKICHQLITIDEFEFNAFIAREIHPFFLKAQLAHPQLRGVLSEFSNVTDPTIGAAFIHRRSLEECLRKIIAEISGQVENFRQELLSIYPFYFEKFRTDGVEYDIYIGPSIAPHKPFDLTLLNTFRLNQLRSMAEVVKLTNSLLPQLTTQLHTTQLIFINPSPIDISFRNDERRFDVEGAYNIRYQVIKKRIDKVTIRQTNERLTQPGKIAMVYYHHLEAEEYKKYIRQLQEENVLSDDFEELELEELQGISGLKAMRVGVRLR